MPHYRDEHQRILSLVADQHWTAISRDDHGLIQACVYAGYIQARPMLGQPGKMLLSLSHRGEHYLAELRDAHRPPPLPPTYFQHRRAEDHIRSAYYDQPLQRQA